MFKQIIFNYKTKIKVSSHALDHLSDGQRKIFKEEELINILTKKPLMELDCRKMADMLHFLGKISDI